MSLSSVSDPVMSGSLLICMFKEDCFRDLS